jgi:hypothetical protein
LAAPESSKAVADLARQSYKMSIDIRKRLDKTRPESSTFVQSVKAAVRTVCAKEDIERPQGVLDSCRTQLHLEYAVSQRQVTCCMVGTTEKPSLGPGPVYEDPEFVRRS